MSLDNYPVFVKWTAILEWIMDSGGKYPKSARFTLANRTIDHALDVQEQIIEAIYTKNRLQILRQVNIYVEKIRILLRLAFRKKYLSMKQFEFIVTEINTFGSMIGGWIKAQRSSEKTDAEKQSL